MNQLTDTFKLSNGVEIPCVGFGTWQTPDGEVARDSVKKAIESGYRHIDTAATYDNEGGVGEGIKASGVSREDLFLTSKVWNSDRGYDKTIAAFNTSLEKLGTDYLDLYLIHWPANEQQFENWDEINVDTWRAITDLYKEGKIKAIGTSNFLPHHLESLVNTEVKPMVNQIEYHPGYTQDEAVEYCKKHDILVEAWSPIGSGRLLDNGTLNAIADKYDKSVAQLCIRYALQHDILPLPKSVTPERIEANTHVFDFEINSEDMEIIDAMKDISFSGVHPDTVEF
ncbi:aldo/keto reductase [Corticicoccus populi]|uniref:Aldo/keto reductase n=1 Tax=Corticicoccus populi TaxID=1812821 RepID=A0ABW5WXI8_9STAP